MKFPRECNLGMRDRQNAGLAGRLVIKFLAKRQRKNRRLIWRVLIVLLLCLPVSSIGASKKMITDQEKRARIEELYESYKRWFPAVSDISPKQAMNLWETQKVIFVDVRTAEEQEISMLPGALKKEEFLRNLQEYKNEVIIGYCTISYRSGKLAKKLSKKGIIMLNLRGGILAWVHDGGKIYDQDGETDRIHVYGRTWNLAPEDYESVW